jgi:uncharacterized protein (DUF305 family)
VSELLVLQSVGLVAAEATGRDMDSKSRRWTAIVVALAVGVFVVVVMTSVGGRRQANDIDGAFLSQMAAHHEAAIEMAELGRRRAVHAELRQLADRIVLTQSSEITELGAAHRRAFGTPLPPAGGHGSLGLDDREMGMASDPADLERARSFDRAFIDMMVAHHQGAIRMARAELRHGADEPTQRLAERVIAAQSREIVRMNRWRETWFGAPSPSGGVPAT